MTNEVNQLPLSPLEESPPRDELPNQGKILEVDACSSPAKEINTMTQGDLDRLRESYSFFTGIQTRIPREGETILSARKERRHLSLNEFRCLYNLYKSPVSDSGWLYFKARLGKKVIKGSHSNVKRWKKRFFFASGDDWEIFPSIAPANAAINESISTNTEEERTRKVFDKIGPGGYFNVLIILDFGMFFQFFALDYAVMSFSGKDNDAFGDGTVAALGDNVQDPLGLGQFSPSSSSDSRLESWLGSGLPLELRLDAKKPKPNRVESMGIMCPAAPGEGTLKKPGKVLEVGVSAMASDAMAKKILVGVILPNKKEKVNKLSLDQVAPKFFHNLGQRIVLGSSLTIRRLLAEFDEREQKAAEEMAKLRDDQEAIIEELAKMEMRKLAHHYPNCGIDLDGMDMDHDLLEKEEAKVEDNKEQGEGKGDTSPLCP
ncbi:hypothetical protein Acr_00g0023540 [Actinidia rufa]|uniref:Uncharacterized protein n=1 Tax=Actinidia rufa TaxID=165716 RepID=A0A7J0DCV6_9ERIC|nr:hypothetical protein Acr_00g0023540 [Actinidia rufa]